MSAEHPTGRMVLQEILAARGGRVSKEREGSQELLASGLVSEVLKETQGNLAPLANLAMWGSQVPVVPWGTAAPKD